MKKQFVLLLCILIGFSSFSQVERNIEVENEVNETLWKPFKQAWESRNAEAYLALHTNDVLRINDWGGIKTGEEFKKSIIQSYSREDNRNRTINFWMEQRFYNGDIGYEVGYFKIESKEAGKEDQFYYGRFHVLLRKESGQWKIAQDWDVDKINGVALTEEDFQKGEILDLD